MFNKLKYILMLPLVMLIGSCTELEEEPVGLLAPESFFQTPDDARAAVFGAYAELVNESAFGRKLPLSLQLLSDMSDIGDPGTASRRLELNEFRMDPNNGMVAAFWPQLYGVISAANSAIDKLIIHSG